MSHPSVCENRKFLVKNASLDQLANACSQALKDMGLKIIDSKSTPDGKSSIFAAEGAALPLIMKTLSYPLRMEDYLKSAQRSGIHVLLAPGEGGIFLHVCGIALENLSGRPEKYPEVNIEEVTDTIKNLELEKRFIKRITSAFPGTAERL